MNAKLKEMRLPPSKPKVNQLQRKYLQERLWAAARSKEYPEPAPPPNIAAAIQKAHELDKVVGQWRQRNRTAERKYDERVKLAKAKVNERILFGTPEEALAAVEAFEKLELG